MIANKDILLFWLRFTLMTIIRFPLEVLSVVLFPISYFFRYVLKIDLFYYLLNSTEDGDFGAKWWRDREGLKPSFFTAWRWTLRNPAWNIHEVLKPKWNGAYTDVRTIKNTIGGRNPLAWASHYTDTYGTNHVYYRVDGKVYGRYSTTEIKYGQTFQAGTTGQRYNLKWRF
jgi:hypothetical protein